MEMDDLFLAHVDAFVTDAPFTGNPAAVVVIPPGLPSPPDSTLASIAAEINLSETAFVSLPHGSTAASIAAASEFSLRWFTPTTEVNLCGHATLATAHALWTLHGCSAGALTFHTLSGPLVVTRDASGSMAMRFPVYFPVRVRDVTGGEYPEYLRQLDEATLRPTPPGSLSHYSGGADAWYSADTRKLFLVLEGGAEATAALTRLAPDTAAMMRVDQSGVEWPVRGIAVTCRAGAGEFASRYFSPWNGIEEDPVNGSSHTVLGSLWAMIAQREGATSGACWTAGSPLTLQGRALSRRGGDISVMLVPTEQSQPQQVGGSMRAAVSHVLLGGRARVFSSGKLTLGP